jgi:hypothetical protein
MFLSKLEDKCACNVMEYRGILEEGSLGTGMKIVEEGGCDEVDHLFV